MTENGQFDLWADGYGAQVHLLEDTEEYPYAGYTKLLNEVYRHVHETKGNTVFDLGFGTGILAKKLYQEGYQISGIDISEQMVDIAREQMPKGNFVQQDFTLGLPMSILDKKYDVIISTYAFHHLDRYEKPKMIEELYRHLNVGGKIIIGDLAFDTLAEVKKFRKENHDAWNSNDMYLVFDEVKKDFPDAECKKVSICAGYIVITKQEM